MEGLPLLLFPRYIDIEKPREFGASSNINYPSNSRQVERLSPQFTLLEQIFNKRQIEIQTSSTGITPEQVLVMETVGSIDKFAKAISRVEGFEWLFEFLSDEIEPDSDFFSIKSPDNPLAGRLFLVMTNSTALERMISLWNAWKKNPDYPFSRGLTKFRDLFNQLHKIRKWDVQDRLLETNILERWQEELKYDGNEPKRFEIELWYRESPDARKAHQDYVEQIIRDAGGTILHSYVLESIAYHGILAELPRAEIQKIVQNEYIELVKCESVFLFWPTGQAISEDFTHEINPENGETRIDNIGHQLSDDPEVALFDGLPLANHAYLANRLTIDDPDNFGSDYPAANRLHGTAMASLVGNGDLNLQTQPLTSKIYVRPIMKPDKNTQKNIECIPDNHIFIDTIHRAVKRMFEGDNGEPPKAPKVKLINLSIGDMYRPFLRTISPLARLLDWLSEKYNVLFLVSAGNHISAINFGEKIDFEKLSPSERQNKIIKALYDNVAQRRIFSPAESINALTVGAVHFDHATEKQRQSYAINPFEDILPSPISPFGGGYRNSVKPDVIYNGGKQIVMQSAPSEMISLVNTAGPPGIRVATPGPNEGVLNATKHCIGTSNSTGLLTHAGGHCLSILKKILNQNNAYDDYSPILTKAMLAHSASWGSGATYLESFFQGEHGATIKELIRKWFGYGKPSIDRVMNCTPQRTTLIGYGQLSNNEGHRYELPLPLSLESKRHSRRLIVTLAWFSPISPKSYLYRNSRLFLKMPEMDFFSLTNEVTSKTSGRGTLQHLIYESARATTFSSGNLLNIDVNCTRETGDILHPVKYGLFVTLEVAEGIEIYEEIRTRITEKVSIRNMI